MQNGSNTDTHSFVGTYCSPLMMALKALSKALFLDMTEQTAHIMSEEATGHQEIVIQRLPVLWLCRF